MDHIAEKIHELQLFLDRAEDQELEFYNFPIAALEIFINIAAAAHRYGLRHEMIWEALEQLECLDLGRDNDVEEN